MTAAASNRQSVAVEDGPDAAHRSTRLARIASERIGGDLLRTTEHTLELVARPVEHDEHLTYIDIVFDGSYTGSVSIVVGFDEEASLAELADLLREHTLDEDVWGGWPTCARHRTHPLTPTVRDAAAVWLCPEADQSMARIGDLDQIG